MKIYCQIKGNIVIETKTINKRSHKKMMSVYTCKIQDSHSVTPWLLHNFKLFFPGRFWNRLRFNLEKKPRNTKTHVHVSIVHSHEGQDCKYGLHIPSKQQFQILQQFQTF